MTVTQKSIKLLRDLWADEKGLSAVEYGLLAAGIAIGLYTVLSGMGTDLNAIFVKIKDNLDTAKTAAAAS